MNEDELNEMLAIFKAKEKDYEAGKYYCHVKYSLEQNNWVIALVEEVLRRQKIDVQY